MNHEIASLSIQKLVDDACEGRREGKMLPTGRGHCKVYLFF